MDKEWINTKEKWIGERIDKSGGYSRARICEELLKRNESFKEKLYVFDSRFGEEYNISDDNVILNIEKLIADDKPTELIEYLYNLIIEKFGVIDLLVRIGHKIADERNNGFLKGKSHIQKEMRELLGIN